MEIIIYNPNFYILAFLNFIAGYVYTFFTLQFLYKMQKEMHFIKIDN